MFGKKKYEEEELDTRPAAKRIHTTLMKDDDAFARDLILMIRDGYPVCANFKELDEVSGNKFLAFLEGAVVALEGKTIKISEYIYLFVKKEDLLDGSIKKWIDQIPTRS